MSASLYDQLHKRLEGNTIKKLTLAPESWACNVRLVLVTGTAIYAYSLYESGSSDLAVVAHKDGTVIVMEPEEGSFFPADPDEGKVPHGIVHNRLLRMAAIPFRVASDGNEWWVQGNKQHNNDVQGFFENDEDWTQRVIFIKPEFQSEPLIKEADPEFEALLAEEEAIELEHKMYLQEINTSKCEVCNEDVAVNIAGTWVHVMMKADSDHAAVPTNGMTPEQAIADGTAPPKELCCNKCDAPGHAVESVTGEWWWHHEDASIEDEHDFEIEKFDGGPKVWCANGCGTIFYSYDNSAYCPVCQLKAKLTSDKCSGCGNEELYEGTLCYSCYEDEIIEQESADKLAAETTEAVVTPCDSKCAVCGCETFTWHQNMTTGNYYWKCETCGYPGSEPEKQNFPKPPHYFPGHNNPLPSEAYMIEHPEEYGLPTAECALCDHALVKLDGAWVDGSGGDVCPQAVSNGSHIAVS